MQQVEQIKGRHRAGMEQFGWHRQVVIHLRISRLDQRQFTVAQHPQIVIAGKGGVPSTACPQLIHLLGGCMPRKRADLPQRDFPCCRIKTLGKISQPLLMQINKFCLTIKLHCLGRHNLINQRSDFCHPCNRGWPIMIHNKNRIMIP